MDILQKILGLKDLQIDSISEEQMKGKHCRVLHLTYCGEEPDTCPVCGAKLYKHGTRKLVVDDTPLTGYPVKLEITIPRKRCANSAGAHVWRPILNEIDEHHKMTRRALLNLTEKSMRTTFADTALDYALSPNTVKSVFVDFMQDNRKNLRFKTPVFLGIDEIKIKHLGEITVITDLEHRTFFDMLKGRNQKQLIAYFMELPHREEVRWVCSDMYRPFEKAIADALPNAQWVIDHFHVVMKANEAVDKVRITVQSKMEKKERIRTKKGLAYTLKQRAKDINAEDAAKLRMARKDSVLAPLMVAFDLKEDFFAIYEAEDNVASKESAIKAFEAWEKSIPEDELYDKFRDLAATVHNFFTQIFNYWDCPIAISNGFTECTNRLIRENNIKGRGYSFEVLRARTLYRQTNLRAILEKGLVDTIGPVIEDNEPTFHFDSTSGEEEYEDEEYEPFPDTDDE